MAEQDTEFLDENVNMFDEEEQVYDTTALFEDPAFPRSPTYSGSQIDTTAKLAAVTQRNEDADTEFDELVRQNNELIALGEEIVLRREAKLRRQQRRKEALDELSYDAVYTGDQLAAETFIDIQLSEEALQANEAMVEGYNELEKQAVASLQNAEMVDDPDYGAEIQGLFADDTGATIDLIRDETTKTLIFQRHLDEYRESIKRHGFDKLSKRVEEGAALMFLPFYDTQSRINVRENEGYVRADDPYQLIAAGEAVRRQIEGLWAMPLEEFEVEVANVFENAQNQSGLWGENELAALAILEQYEKGTHGAAGVFFDDIVGFVDAVPGAAALLRFGKGSAVTVAGAAKLAGARRTASVLDADAINKTMRAFGAGEDAAEVSDDSVRAIGDLIPSALKPGIAEPGVGISGSLAKKLEEIDEVGKSLEGITTQGRLSDAQLQELADAKIEQIKRTSVHTVEDFKVVTDPQTKVSYVEQYIGKKNGGGYATENAAKGAATRRGFENVEIVEEKGHYFIKQSDVIEEIAPNGMPLIKRPDNSAEVIPDTGPIRAGVQNPDLSLPQDLVVRRHDAELAQIKFREKLVKPLEQFMRPMTKKDMQHLNAVMTKGRNERKWYTIDEFSLEWKKASGRDPKDYQFAAYAAAVKANNVDHMVRNLHVYTERARRGIKTVSINHPRYKFDKINGVERTPSIEEAAKMRMFDIEDGIVRTGKGDAPVEELDDLAKKLESGEYKVISLEEGVRIDGDPVHTMLVPSRSVTISPLARQQVPYVPGGHLIRRTPWFGKQVRTGKYKDGTEYVESPAALFAYRTEMSGKRHLDEINKALSSYSDYLSARTPNPSVQNALAKVAIRKQIAESPFESLDELEKLVNAGKIDPHKPIELVFDRGLPKEYWQDNGLLDNPNIHKAFNARQDILDGTTQWTRTTGRDYYGHRTDGLMSPHEEADVVLDPLASISKGLENAAKTYAFDHYFNRSIEEWVRLAGPHLELRSLGGSSDVRAAFYNGQLNEQLKINDPNLWSKLEENRTIIKRTMGLQTPSQERFDMAKRNLARMIEDKGGELGTKAVMWGDNIQSNNPINALNSLIFDAWLGMGDISQLWVQTQTILTASSASPKYGSQAISMFLPMRWLTVNKSDNLLDYIAKTAKPLHGQTPDDFKQMVKQFRESGWNAPGGEMAYLANHSNSVGSAGITAKINRGRQNLRLFFNEAERWNRTVAWQIAWKELSEQYPNLSKTSDEWQALMNKRTSDYSINMTAISNSKIQKGIFSPMTRFMGYQFRLLETILPKSWGGNPSFSRAAKARMAASQFVLYGAKGAPFGHKISDMAEWMYQEATGQEIGELGSKFIESGALDSILYLASDGELNTDVAERAGFGRGIDYTLARMSDSSMSSALAAYAGPAGSFTSRYAESVRRVMTYMKGTRGPLDIDREDAKFVANELFVKHVSFAKRIDKARMIWRLGQVVDPKSGRPLFDASELEGYAALLGVPLYEETHMYELYDELESYDEEVKFNGQLLARLDREAFRLMSEGEFKAADLNMKQAALILAQYQDDFNKQRDIAKYATRELGYTGTQWEALLKRIETRLGPEALPPEGLRYEQDEE